MSGSLTVTGNDRPYFAALRPPDDLAVAGADDGTFSVTFVVPEGVATVEVELVNGSNAGEVVTAQESPVVIRTDAPTACVVARSIGGGGRVSVDAGPVCAG